MPVKAKTAQVNFSDGTTLVVSQETWDTAMRLSRLEESAQAAEPYDDPDAQMFRVSFYPRLVAATIAGEIPSEEETRAMPIEELNLWFKPVRDLNPDWFTEAEPEKTPEEEAAAVVADTKKKKRQPDK